MDAHQFFRDFEHTSDAGIEVEAPTRADLFACAAIGLARIMVAPDPIGCSEHRTIRVEGTCDEDLMHAALSTALSLFLRSGFIWRDASVQEGPAGLALKLIGERFEPCRHQMLTKLKAVTRHQLKVERADAAWKARIMFDV